MRRRHRGVVVPPDRPFGLRIADDELVPGGAAGVLAGLDDQRAVLGENALAAANRLLDKRGNSQIPAQLGARFNALFGKPVCGHEIGHENLLSIGSAVCRDRVWWYV